MALDDVLEGGERYGSPVEFLEQVENQLPEDQEYWIENSTGRKETFETLTGLREYLETMEDNWIKFRDFQPIDADSEYIKYMESEEAEYLGAEFPYVVLETDFNSASAGKAGSVSFGYVAEKESEVVEIPVSGPSND